jgi:hypothetical protein
LIFSFGPTHEGIIPSLFSSFFLLCILALPGFAGRCPSDPNPRFNRDSIYIPTAPALIINTITIGLAFTLRK